MIVKRLFKIIALLVSLTGLSLWGGNAYAAACASVTGNWGTAGTWSCGHVPVAGDTVTITLGTTVTLNVNTNVLASLTVNGVLTTLVGSSADLYIGGNIVNNGTINMQLSASTNTIYLAGANITSTFSGSGTWLLDNLDLNGAGGNPCTGACKVELSGSPNLQFINANLFAGNSATFTFNALGNATATVTFNRAGNQTVASTGVTYPNLVLGGSGNKTPSAAVTINVLGSLTVSSGVTWAGNTNNPTSNIAGNLIIAGSFTAGSGTTSVAGNFTNSGTFTANTSTVNFNGTVAQTIGGAVTTTFNNLTVANTGAGNTTLLINSSVAGNLSVNSGTLFLSTFTADRTAGGGTITVAIGATLNIGGTNTLPANYTTHTISATSTVVYSGANQSVAAEGAPGYGNLTLSGSGTKTAAGSFITRGNLTISGVTFASVATVQTVNGNISNTGTHTVTTGNITLSGGAAVHTLSGNGIYGNLILNDVQGATLTGSPTVSGVLTLTSGIMTTGANVLEVTSSCGVSGGGAVTYVDGNLTLHYPTFNPGTTTCTFPIGSAAAYSPATVAMLNVSTSLANSSLTARTYTPDHADTTANISGVNAAKSVNRYWTLTPGGSMTFATYNTTFTFVAGNIDGGAATANFIIGRKSSGVWNYPTMGAKNPTNTTATGMTQAGGFGEFVIGERIFPSITILKTVRAYWDPFNGTIDPLVFAPNAKNIPGAVVEYTIISSNSNGPADYNSTFVTDPIPANTKLYVNDIGGGGSGPVLFTQGATSSTLTYTFTALNDPGDDLSFSNDGGTTFTATPSFDASGCDNTVPAITHIRVSPKGAFIGSGIPNPSFQLKFRVCVK
jgi:hypothetical protein